MHNSLAVRSDISQVFAVCTGNAAKRARTEGGGPDGRAAGPGPGTHLERELERSLREFVRLRTVSSDPTLREECFRGAKYLATLLESLGAQHVCAPPMRQLSFCSFP